jgi:glycyl-tRNA synthetase
LLEDQDQSVIDQLVDSMGSKSSYKDDEEKYQAIVAFLLDNEDTSDEILKNCEVIDPHTNVKGDWTKVRQFNLMFKTHVGPVSDSSSIVYLRPETAQGIFVNFLNVQGTSRQKLPFGIAQIGKAFRNEITTGNFIFRTREFEQMEMEFFCKAGETDKWLEYWSNERLEWFKSLGVTENKLRLRPHGPDELAHYSSACFDIEYQFDFGWSELEGIADRGTYDLDQHMKHSNKKLTYFDQANNEHIVPAVVESSAGVDRAVLTILADSFTQEEVNGEKRNVMKFDPKIAPITAAIFPLFNKEGMPEIAKKITDDLKNKFSTFYDAGGSIGKRYRRQDEAGTPFGITVDYDTLTDNTVTLRDRDTMEQKRISIDSIASAISDSL